MEQKHLTLRQLVKKTGLTYYKLIYLRDTGKLPIIRESQGRGYPTLYHPDAIQIIKDHLAKRNVND